MKGRCWFTMQGMNLGGNRFNQLIDGDRGIVRRGVWSAPGGSSNIKNVYDEFGRKNFLEAQGTWVQGDKSACHHPLNIGID
jgi:hypothetical protein